MLVTPLQLADGYAVRQRRHAAQPTLVAGIHASSAGQPEGRWASCSRSSVFRPRATRLTPDVRDPVPGRIDGVVSSSDGTAYYSFNNYEGVPVAGKDRYRKVWAAAQAGHLVVRRHHQPGQRPAIGTQYVVVAMVEQGGFGADVSRADRPPTSSTT